MAICSTTKAQILEEIADIDETLVLARASLKAALGTEIEDYTFDSAEARQKAKIRDPEKIQKSIDILKRQRAHLCGKYNGTNITRLNLRRKF